MAAKQEAQLISKIAARAIEIGVVGSGDFKSMMRISMDIEAAHCQIPLDLEKLLAFDNGNFGHDVGGICRYLNRETCEIEHCFVPRCALHCEDFVPSKPCWYTGPVEAV